MRERRFEPERIGRTLCTQFLDDYELTPEQFATAIGLPLDRVEPILAGRERVDADFALRLARLFGGTADGWMHWQMGWELWRAHELIGDELEAITPLDPDTRVSVRDDEPLEPELVEELRERLADVRDPRRWVVVSTIGDKDVPLHEFSISRMFYNAESNCYATELRGATPFKNQNVAEAVAQAMGERDKVLEVTKQDLEKPHYDASVDRTIRDHFLKSAGHGMSEWDASTYLRDKADMTAYLEAAAENADPQVIAMAIADVMKAMAQQTTVEYLRERGELGDRLTFDDVLGKVPNQPPEDGDEPA